MQLASFKHRCQSVHYPCGLHLAWVQSSLPGLNWWVTTSTSQESPALQAGERTLTAEELAAAEAARLEALEAARQRRMRAAPAAAAGDDVDGDFGAGDDGGDAPAPAGGYAARRAKRRRVEAAGPSGAQWRRRGMSASFRAS